MSRIESQSGVATSVRKKIFFPAIVAAIFLTAGESIQPRAIGEEPANKTNAVNYGRPFESPTRPALIPLPPGQIEPAGWLRDWAITAKQGYTGHADEIHPAFKQAWAADYKMTGDQLTFWDRGAWPYEGGGYWFDGLGKLALVLHDDDLLQKAKSRYAPVIDNSNDNGIIFMWWLDKNNPEHVNAAVRKAGVEAHAWPIWANGLFGRALSGYYYGTRDERALKAMETAYSKNSLWSNNICAILQLWPAFETYTWTGNKEIKRQLTEFFKANKIETAQPEKPVRMIDVWYNRMPDEKRPWFKQPDHGVRFNESVIPWLVGYLWTGDESYLTAACSWYEIIERGDDGMQPNGLPVCDENSGPTGSLRGSETCNVSAFTWSQITLLRVTGKAQMADRVERAIFNAAPSAVSRDYKTHVYHQTPNRVNTTMLGWPPFQYSPTQMPLCCTAALNRFLPNYLVHMWMATYDNGLAATFYGPCKVSAMAGDGVPVELACKTNYPFDETIDVEVKPAREAKFPLSFRIPGWCQKPEITVSGETIDATANENGFVRIERTWKRGDSVSLRFPMTPVVKTGHDNNAADTPYATVSYGPLLFALAIPDTKDANTPDATFKWNYALDLPKDDLAGKIAVERRPMPEKWNWQLDAPLKLRVQAKSFDWKPVLRPGLATNPVGPDDASPFQPDTIMTFLPEKPVTTDSAAEEISLIPYGCTKFRISMFPITEPAAEKNETETEEEK